MSEILLALATGVGAAIFLIIKQNSKLKSEKKLHDIEVEDAKLETNQETIKTSKKQLDKFLKEVDKQVMKDLSDKEIEDYWNKGKK
jgi:septal ring factor EnvC (AmiA/AmiB activator)